MAQNFPETAHRKTDLKKYHENFDRINWDTRIPIVNRLQELEKDSSTERAPESVSGNTKPRFEMFQLIEFDGEVYAINAIKVAGDSFQYCFGGCYWEDESNLKALENKQES